MDFARGMLKLGHTGSLFVAKITGGFNADQKSLQKQHAGRATHGSQEQCFLELFRSTCCSCSTHAIVEGVSYLAAYKGFVRTKKTRLP